jgi:Neocarzinostatin family
MSKLSKLATAAALVVSLGGIVGITSVGADTAPVVTVTPSTGLQDGNTVTVSATGFPPNLGLYILECTNVAKPTLNDCAFSKEVGAGIPNPITTDASGNLPASKFQVSAGAIGSNGGTCGTKSSDLTCIIGISDAAQTAQGQTTITFADPSTLTTSTTQPSSTSTTMAPVVKKAKKTTITCVKGKATKKITAVHPACPKGWKKK